MIDLRSDTVTTPSPAMREAAATAEVGDDVYGEDPTINELERRAAAIVGMEDALFVPSGTMGNQVAAMAHTVAGQSIVVERASHIFGWECGGLAVHAGLQVVPVDGGERGLYTPAQLEDAIVEPAGHRAETGLVAIENTHNRAGGTAHHPRDVAEVASLARDHELPVHLDGARLFNAAVALDLEPQQVAEPVDSVMFCLSKGLGAPVGSILAGDAAFIADARTYRRRLGGGMRQAGIIAGPGQVALDDWERLENDHRRATDLAHGLNAIDSLTVPEPETNIVLVDLRDSELSPEAFVECCEEAGVLGFPFGPQRVRFCTHWDIDDRDISTSIEAVEKALA